MARTFEQAQSETERLGIRGRLLSDILGAVIIFAVWALLWAWVLAGVIGPLSTIRSAAPSRDTVAIERA